MSRINNDIKQQFKLAFETRFKELEIVRMPVLAFDGIPHNFTAIDYLGKRYRFFCLLDPVAQRLTIKCRALNKSYIHYYGAKAGKTNTAAATPPDEARQRLNAIRQTLENNQ